MLPIYFIRKIYNALAPNIIIRLNWFPHANNDAYQNTPVGTKTAAGFVPRPSIQRKTTKESRPMAEITVITEPAPICPKEPRDQSRQNFDKAALAEYFDNDILPSRDAAAQEKLDAWRMQTAFELENADIEKSEQNTTPCNTNNTQADHTADWAAYFHYIWYVRKVRDAEQQYIENAARKHPKDYDAYISEINNYLAEFDAKETAAEKVAMAKKRKFRITQKARMH